MLVLARSVQQELVIGEDIRIKVLRVSGTTEKLGIEAPKEVSVQRVIHVKGDDDGES